MNTIDPRNELMLKHGNACLMIARFNNLPLEKVLDGLVACMARKSETLAAGMQTEAQSAGVEIDEVTSAQPKEPDDELARHLAWQEHTAA